MNTKTHASITTPLAVGKFYSLYLALAIAAILVEHDLGRQFIRASALFIFMLPFISLSIPKNIKIYALLAVFFIFFTFLSSSISPYVDHSTPSSTLLHWALIIPIGILVLKSQPSLHTLFCILTISLLLALIPAGIDLYTQQFRYDGFHGQPIMWGNLAILSGFLCLYLALKSPIKNLWLLGLLLFLCGLFISAVSQSRGGWITVATLSPLIIIALYKKLPKKAFYSCLAIILLVVFSALSSQSLGLNQRFSTGFDNVVAYYEGHENASYSSIGQRFEFWQSALRANQERPFWGIGYDGFHQWIKQDPHYVGGLRYKHAHSQYFDLLLWGIPSLVAFILMIAFVYRAIVLQSGTSEQLKTIKVCGFILIFAYLEFSLTESFWTSKLGSGYFLFISIYLLILSDKYSAKNTLQQSNAGKQQRQKSDAN